MERQALHLCAVSVTLAGDPRPLTLPCSNPQGYPLQDQFREVSLITGKLPGKARTTIPQPVRAAASRTAKSPLAKSGDASLLPGLAPDRSTIPSPRSPASAFLAKGVDRDDLGFAFLWRSLALGRFAGFLGFLCRPRFRESRGICQGFQNA